MPSKFPPEPPACPICGHEKVEFRREHDNFEAHFKNPEEQPGSTSYIFGCPRCGSSFAVTIPKHNDERVQEYL